MFVGNRSLSLSDYAEANPPRSSPVCTVCSLPEAEEINAFYREQGPRHTTILRWLEAKGRTMTLARIVYHYQRGHSRAPLS